LQFWRDQSASDARRALITLTIRLNLIHLLVELSRIRRSDHGFTFLYVRVVMTASKRNSRTLPPRGVT